MKKIVLIAIVLCTFGLSPLVFAQQGSKTTLAKPAPGASKKVPEEEKINLLLKYVATLKGATFIRNGDEYPAKEAAEHLQMKRKKAGSRVQTARQFIDGLASESSISGKAYEIRMKDGKIYSSREVLLKELARIEKL